ncbi:MAG: hypothetical protein E7035_04325 [Verrucomicrobiaceae bacterium]|nr:hypothetical protein [Verrucomicrobiaceae bacterium]
MTNQQINKLFKEAKVQASAEFVDKVMANISIAKEQEEKLDTLCDRLFKQTKVQARANFTDKIITQISKQKHYSTMEKIARYFAFVAMSACVMIVAWQYGFPNQYTVSESDFAQMSDLDSEISNLSNLIYEQEFFDAFLKL